MKISVIITSYNQKLFLKEAIESVLNQTRQPDQVIIVDDASEDGSQDMIAAYASRNPELIIPIHNERNQGVSSSRNIGLQTVNGDYVVCLDGDDRFLPEKFEEEVKFISDHPNAGIIFSNHYYINSNGQRLGQWINDQKVPTGNIFCKIFAWELPKKNMFRNELVNYQSWKRVGFYDCRLKIYEDYDMRIRLTKKLSAEYIDKALSEYRTHFAGLSQAKYSDHVKAREYIYHKNRTLLYDINDSSIQHVEKKIHESIGELAHKAADRVLVAGNYKLKSRVNAFKYYLKGIKYFQKNFNYKLLLTILLPYSTCQFIKNKISKRDLP